MMVVVLGDEETEINDGHRLLQTRMQRGSRKLCLAHPCKPVDDAAAGGGEVGKDG